MRETKPVMEKADPGPTFIAQSHLGQDGMEYYISHFAATLGDLDKRPVMRDMLGEEGYNDYLKRMGEDCRRSTSRTHSDQPRPAGTEQRLPSPSSPFRATSGRPSPAAGHRRPEGSEAQQEGHDAAVTERQAARAKRPVLYGSIPSFFATRSSVSTSRSTCFSVCAAVQEIRSRFCAAAGRSTGLM